MPVFVLALTNPSLYLAAIMKTVTLGQQAGETNARSAGQELVGSTLMGALIGACVWLGLSLLANLWMLALWLMAAALWCGAGDVRSTAHALPAVLLEQRTDHGADPARPGDRGQRQRQERPAGLRRPDEPVRGRGGLCVGHGLGAGALARIAVAADCAASRNQWRKQHDRQESVGRICRPCCCAWSCRWRSPSGAFAISCGSRPVATAERGSLFGLRPLLVVMLVMMLGTILQIVTVGIAVRRHWASSTNCTRPSTTRR